MIYSDKPGRRIFVPARRHTTPRPADLDDAKTRVIRDVAATHPKSVPAEVYAEIRYGRRRDDITRDMVRHVLAQPDRPGEVAP